MEGGENGDNIPLSIPEFYKGRSIFITGFTGFIGKVIVEKLLYSCPEINNVYVLVRSKRGQDPHERAKETIKSMAFSRLKKKYPGALESKIKAISGDISEDKLGISQEDEEVLRREVSVIFHGAASVRFDDPLNVAFRQNTLGAKKIVDLALTMPKLAALVYISTAYSNCDHHYIKEEIYPPKADWRELMKITEKVDTGTLQLLTNKYIGKLPNTYIFTKSLSEQIINEYRDRLPVSIVRPSIVVPAWKEPMPGWTDNKYGPLAVILGFLLGIVRCSWVDVKQMCNYINSDLVVNATIIVSWKTAMKHNPKQGSVAVYNTCLPYEHTIDHEQFSLIYRQGDTLKNLIKEKINFICLMLVKNEHWYWFNVLIRHLLPAAIVDLILVAAKKKPMLVNIRRKVFIATYALKYFTMRTFLFEDSKFKNLMTDLRSEDKDVFGWPHDEYDICYIYDRAFEVGKSTLLQPLYDDFETNRRRLQMLYIVDRGAVFLTYSLLAYLVYAFNIPQAVLSFIISLVYF